MKPKVRCRQQHRSLTDMGDFEEQNADDHGLQLVRSVACTNPRVPDLRLRRQPVIRPLRATFRSLSTASSAGSQKSHSHTILICILRESAQQRQEIQHGVHACRRGPGYSISTLTTDQEAPCTPESCPCDAWMYDVYPPLLHCLVTPRCMFLSS